jgi:hypothetical protein
MGGHIYPSLPAKWEVGAFLLYSAHLFVILSLLRSLEDRLHLGKTQIKFGFSLGLHLTLRLTSLNYSRSDFLKYIWKIIHLFVILQPENYI